MAVANTLTYYDTATITSIKSFIVQAPGAKNPQIFLHKIEKFLEKHKTLENMERVEAYGRTY